VEPRYSGLLIVHHGFGKAWWIDEEGLQNPGCRPAEPGGASAMVVRGGPPPNAPQGLCGCASTATRWSSGRRGTSGLC